MWCIGSLTPEYRQRMYNLIDLYHQPYNPKQPVVCVDEKSKQLLACLRPTLPLKPGAVSKEDSEYERRGTRNIFVAVEPKGAWRFAQVTRRRCKADFVAFIECLLTTHYAQAETVHLVLDNLNIHFAKVFVDVLGQRKANRLLKRLVFHYTPKHGSWLNLAEVEISVLSRQCLNRRIPTEAELKSEIEAWQVERNTQRTTINWKLTKQAIDKKLGRHYVA
ncbi:MAG: IS630 family transposase [Stenomitos frigidus ULC029]